MNTSPRLNQTITKSWQVNLCQLCFLFFLSISVYGHDIVKKSHDPRWLKMLHYHETSRGHYQSQISSPNFFLSKQGARHPDKELSKFLKLIEAKDYEQVCRFPLRLEFVKNHFQKIFEQFDEKQCQEWMEFSQEMKHSSVWLVFSAPFSQTAASAFGHTFLRLNRYDKGKRYQSELLDLGVSYGANIENLSFVQYNWLGLFGGLSGQFHSLPYFYKVREYNDFESRDLWSYPIVLTDQEKYYLIAHLWELLNNGAPLFDYYYLRQNCSYQILRLLEVITLEDYVAKLPLYIIPSDTISVLWHAKRLGQPDLRQSAHKTYLQSYQSAGNDAREIFHQYKDQPVPSDLDEVQSLRLDQQALLYDLLINYYDYTYAEQLLLKSDTKAHSLKRSVLHARAQVGKVSTVDKDITESQEQPPHLGHRSRRLGVYGQHRLQSRGIGVSYRPAYHDLLDPSDGKPLASSELGELAMSYTSQGLQLDRVSLVAISQIPVLSRGESKKSYNLNLQSQRMVCRDQTLCMHSMFEYDVGGTWQIGPYFYSSLYMSHTLNLSRLAHKDNHRHLNYSLGPKLRFLWVSSMLSAKIDVSRSYYALSSQYEGHYHIDAEMRSHLWQTFAIQLQRSSFGQQLQVAGYFYF